MKPSLATAVSQCMLLAATSAAQEPAAGAGEQPPRGLTVREEDAFDGYTLFAPLRSGTIFLLDMQGEVVHRWEHGLPPLAVYLLDNGHVVFLSRINDNPLFFGGGIGGRIRELDWDGKVVWEYVLSNEQRILHHDLEPLPNGNFLAIAWEALSPDQAVALGRDPKFVAEQGLWPDVVLEIEPTRPSGGKIVWEWRAADHLIQDFDRSKSNYGTVVDRADRLDVNGDHRDQPPMSEEEKRRLREEEKRLRALGYAGGSDDDEAADEKPPERRADWLHTNSVDYDPKNDLILLSSPRFDEFWIIDHSTTTEEARTSRGGRFGKGGDILYRWGNPRQYAAGRDEDQRLFGQHQPDWIRSGCPGAGNVLVFNNGSGRKPVEHSSVDEIVLPFDPKQGFARAPRAAFEPRAPVWSYSATKPDDFYSFFISGCQRLPNGNTFICSGAQGRLFEVTRDGRIVWEYWNPFGGEIAASFGNADPNPPQQSRVQPVAVFRATRLSPSHPGLAGRELGNAASR